MTKKTKELLLECKKAGYERVTVFVSDKRVPISITLSQSKYKTEGGWMSPIRTWWGEGCKEDGIYPPFKVICGFPNRRDQSPPAIWSIVKKCGLTAGLLLGGCGCSEGHEIHPDLTGLLTPGYYDLSKLQ